MSKRIYIIGAIAYMKLINKVVELFMAGEYEEVTYVYPDDTKSFEELVEQSFKHIKDADLIIAVKKPDGTFGEGAIYEIVFAKQLNKDIMYIEIPTMFM